MNKIKTILFSFLILLTACKEDIEFKFDLDDLIDTKWGIPEIIETAPDVIDYDLSAPTIFYEDGHMIIGASRYDFWRIRNSRSIHIEQMAEIWYVIELTPYKLHVEKSKYPSGSFILRCVYPAINQE